MWDNEQWQIYAMFAALARLDGDAWLAESIRIEAEGEGLDKQYAKGEAEFNVWLRLYAKHGFTKPKYRFACTAYGFNLSVH